jgi:hypothetical protein
MIKLLIICFFFSGTVLAKLPKERRLKKLSMHIKGSTPTVEEYTSISTVTDENLEEFFLNKTSEYLRDQEHVQKMNIRLNQLFRLGLPRYIEADYNRAEQNSLNDLFKEIVSENQSWNNLLIGKNYKLSMSSQDFSSQSDFAFLGAVIPFKDYPQVSGGILNSSDEILQDETVESEEQTYDRTKTYSRSHEFGSQDERIAGALTTERFFGRYVNTGVNKNRKRAAAVFRVFLCDDMEAAITDSSDRTDYILDFVFPKTSGMTQSDVAEINLAESAHGQRADCMSCHYKLDPLGQNFGGSGISLAPMSFKGALTYKSTEGEDVSINTNGLGDLAEKIVKQKDYKLCQTEQFWTWFIGEDRYLEPKVHEELVEAFDKVDGKVNDFISYLVNRDEFFDMKSLSPESELAFKVKKTLKNCNQCHDKEGLPRLSDWPIEDESGDMKYWVKEIQKSLGLTGSERTMPPASHVWQPSAEDIEEIKDWINIGAPNEQGNRQIP